MADCRAEVKKAAGEDFTQEEIDQLMDELEKTKKDALVRQADLHDELAEKGRKIFQDKEDILKQKEFNTYKRIEKKAVALAQIEKLKNRKNPVFEWINQKTAGNQSGLIGSRDATEIRQKDVHRQLSNSFTSEIDANNLFPLFNARDEATEVDYAKASLRKSVTDPNMQKLGEITAKHLDLTERLYNKEGIFFRDLEDRLTRNFHSGTELMKTHDKLSDRIRFRRQVNGDPNEIFEKAFQRWKEFIYPNAQASLLDDKKVFKFNETEDSRQNFLREAFKTLTNGGNPFNPPADMAARARRGRVIFWKDEEAMVKYNRKFGVGTIQDAVMHEFMKASRDIGLLEDWGHNPKATMRSILQAASKDPKLKFRFGEINKALIRGERNLSDLDGSLTKPIGLRTSWGPNLRAFTNIVKLPTVLLSSFPDLAPITLERTRLQGSFLKAAFGAITDLIKGKNSADKKVMADIIGSYTNVSIGNSARWFGLNEAAGTVMSKLQRLQMKLSFMHGWDYTHRAGVASQLGRHLAINKNIAFDALKEDDRRILGLYRIDKDDWDLLRKFPVREADGKEYLAPDGARSIPDEDVKETLKRQGFKRITRTRIENFKTEVERKFGMYFQDRIDHTILHPGVNDRQFFLRGTRSGTFWGEMARFSAHFKLYGTAFVSKPLARLIYGRGAETFWESMLKGKGDLRGMAQLMTYGLFLGYMSMQFKNIVRNESLDDPFDLEVLLQAFTTGGGAGIYNDLIFNNFNKFGSDPLARAAGPDVALIDEAVRLFSGSAAAVGAKVAGKQKPTFPTNALFHAIKKDTPFINMFWYKPVMDWLIWNHIQNSIDPGYFNKQLNRLQTQGKHYLIN